jgi:hypothetical protein
MIDYLKLLAKAHEKNLSTDDGKAQERIKRLTQDANLKDAILEDTMRRRAYLKSLNPAYQKGLIEVGDLGLVNAFEFQTNPHMALKNALAKKQIRKIIADNTKKLPFDETEVQREKARLEQEKADKIVERVDEINRQKQQLQSLEDLNDKIFTLSVNLDRWNTDEVEGKKLIIQNLEDLLEVSEKNLRTNEYTQSDLQTRFSEIVEQLKNPSGAKKLASLPPGTPSTPTPRTTLPALLTTPKSQATKIRNRLTPLGREILDDMTAREEASAGSKLTDEDLLEVARKVEEEEGPAPGFDRDVDFDLRDLDTYIRAKSRKSVLDEVRGDVNFLRFLQDQGVSAKLYKGSLKFFTPTGRVIAQRDLVGEYKTAMLRRAPTTPGGAPRASPTARILPLPPTGKK